MSQITKKVLYHIQKKGRGYVFCAKDFLKISHRNTLDKLLHRLNIKGTIRDIGWGLFDYPIIDRESSGYKPPSIIAIIRALQVQFNDKFQYSGEYAAY